MDPSAQGRSCCQRRRGREASVPSSPHHSMSAVPAGIAVTATQGSCPTSAGGNEAIDDRRGEEAPREVPVRRSQKQEDRRERHRQSDRRTCPSSPASPPAARSPRAARPRARRSRDRVGLPTSSGVCARYTSARERPRSPAPFAARSPVTHPQRAVRGVHAVDERKPVLALSTGDRERKPPARVRQVVAEPRLTTAAWADSSVTSSSQSAVRARRMSPLARRRYRSTPGGSPTRGDGRGARHAVRLGAPAAAAPPRSA